MLFCVLLETVLNTSLILKKLIARGYLIAFADDILVMAIDKSEAG